MVNIIGELELLEAVRSSPGLCLVVRLNRVDTGCIVVEEQSASCLSSLH